LAAPQAEQLVRRLAGADVVDAHASEWAQRRGGPIEVRKTIGSRPWPPEDLRILMGLDTVKEAEDLLLLFGCVKNDDGMYELGDDMEAGILRLAEEDGFRLLSMSAAADTSEEVIAERVKILLSGGGLEDLPKPRWL
jgi:hypothetical protein